jgi:molybdopterin-containing oxidoreductase family membrane subunit
MAANGHNHAGMWVFPRTEEMTRDVASKTFALPQKLAIALLLSGVLLVLGFIGFIARSVDDGFGDHGPWGYYAAIFSFLFMITGAAPLAAVAFRFTKSHWRRPLSRISELFSVVSIFTVLMFIPLMLALPSIKNPGSGEDQLEIRRTIWFEGPIGSPHVWDVLGVIFLALTGLFILWLSATPDMAEARLTATGFRRKLYGLLAGHWYGTKRQWNTQKAGLAMLGAFYFMFLIYVQFIIVTDYAMSLVPGWKDSILPPLYSVTSFQSSLGLILVVLFILRRWGGYREYIGIAPFWSASKILLGLTLLWTYHLFAFFITYWYGRMEVEQNIIKYFLVESYGGIFAANFFFGFVMPFLILLWNPVRKTDWGPALAGLSAVVAAFLFNLRMLVGAFNAGDIYDIGLEAVPPAAWPDVWDVFMVLGGLGLAALVYLAATRVIPVLSLWEIKEGAKYQRMDTLIRGRYLVLAKPE